jgi:hypothetical protein
MKFQKFAPLGVLTMMVIALNGCGGVNSTIPNGDNPANVANGTRRVNRATIQRPTSDFLSAQGTVFPGPGGYFAFSSSRSPMPNCDGQPLGKVDYAGVTNAFIVAHGGPSLGTTITGSVHQSDNGDGTSSVSVELDATNALSFAACLDPNTGNVAGPYFGSNPRQVLAGAAATLGSSHMSVSFTIAGTGPNAPLPDLESIASICPAPAPCFKSLKFSASARGPLDAIYGVADGTPGTLSIEQTGTFHLMGRSGIDGFTAEFVQVQPAY